MEVDIPKVHGRISDIDNATVNSAEEVERSPSPSGELSTDLAEGQALQSCEVGGSRIDKMPAISSSTPRIRSYSTGDNRKIRGRNENVTTCASAHVFAEQSNEMELNAETRLMDEHPCRETESAKIQGNETEDHANSDEAHTERKIFKDDSQASNDEQETNLNVAKKNAEITHVQNTGEVLSSENEPVMTSCRNISSQGDVFSQLSKRGSLIKECVLNKDRSRFEKSKESPSIAALKEDGSFCPSVCNSIESDSDSDAEKENRLREALEVLLFPTVDSNADDARIAFNQVRRSLRCGKQIHTKRMHHSLREIYRVMKDFEEDQFVLEKALVVLRRLAREMPSTQKTIAETGGVKHIMETIKRFKECESVQDQGIFALLCLTGESVAREHIVEEGGAECVSWAMREFQDVRTILANGSTTLCNLAFASPETKMRIGKVGGIDALVSAMDRHQADADLQARCCLALRNLTCESRANQWIAGIARAMEFIIRYMKCFPRDVNIQCQCCVTLANICSEDAENRERATGIGVLEVCMDAMERHMEYGPLIEHGLAVLRNMSRCNEENQLRIGSSGGLNLILRALKEHRVNQKVLVRGCDALRHLFFSQTNRQAMSEIEGLDPLLRVLREGENIPGVAEGAVLALGNAICDQKEAKRLVGRYGGIAAVIDVMSKHLDSETIQEYGCLALRNLADSDEVNTRLLGDSGAVDIAIFAMMGYPNNVHIQEHSCAMLFNMAFSERNMRIMKDLDVVRVVNHATQFHLQNAYIQCQGSALLHRLQPMVKSSSLLNQKPSGLGMEQKKISLYPW